MSYLLVSKGNSEVFKTLLFRRSYQWTKKKKRKEKGYMKSFLYTKQRGNKLSNLMAVELHIQTLVVNTYRADLPVRGSMYVVVLLL